MMSTEAPLADTAICSWKFLKKCKTLPAGLLGTPPAPDCSEVTVVNCDTRRRHCMPAERHKE